MLSSTGDGVVFTEKPKQLSIIHHTGLTFTLCIGGIFFIDKFTRPSKINVSIERNF